MAEMISALKKYSQVIKQPDQYSAKGRSIQPKKQENNEAVHQHGGAHPLVEPPQKADNCQ